MPHLNPTWQISAATAVGLLLLTTLLRWAGRTRLTAVAGEATVVVSLYTAWQWIGTITHRNVDAATSNALAIWNAQRWLHLPSELAMQQAMIPHPWLVQLANGYYLYGHFNPIIVLLVWAFLRHRDDYPRVRRLLGLLTAAAFVVHFIPVAPPRLVPQLGFRDVALEYGQSVYGSFGAGIPGQLLAMPSLHVGWAILVAYVVITVSTSRWRWLVLIHPIAMSVVVAVTANHWWADGIVSGLLLVLCVSADRAGTRILAALRRPPEQPAAPAAIPALADLR